MIYPEYGPLTYLQTLGYYGVVAVAILHFLLATSVTIHVLLHKRDVAATISWMGLAWLSPVVGSALYVMFGINRVKRKAFRLKRRHAARQPAVASGLSISRRDHLASLERATTVITGQPAKAGTKVDLLRSGDEAYPRMLSAIAQARNNIALSSYIFRGDSIGLQFIDALADAKKRGVDVRVIIDGVGSGYLFSAAYMHLRRRGIPAARFLHTMIPWRMAFLNLRNHKKILVIDGTRAFTGGLNIGDENLLGRRPRHPVRDVHFEIEGPVVTQLMEAFATDWLFATDNELKGVAWFPSLKEIGSATTRVITSGPDQDIEKIELSLLQAINCAERFIKIMTPYFLPGAQLMTALALAVMRGVEVDIVIPRRSDHAWIDWAVRAHIGPLVASGARVWMSREPFEHAKLMTVDGRWSLIGSSNWDVRSLRLNFELNVEVYDDAFANLLGQRIEGMQADPMTLGMLNGRRLPARLRDSVARLMLPYL